MPNKFKKLIWIKRGDFLIVNRAEGDEKDTENNAGKVKYIIKHILNGDQVKNLKNMQLWYDIQKNYVFFC